MIGGIGMAPMEPSVVDAQDHARIPCKQPSRRRHDHPQTHARRHRRPRRAGGGRSGRRTDTGCHDARKETAGLGWVQREGGPIEEVRPGDVVWFPPGLKHWHGATPTTAMTHTAIQETLNGKNVDWMEKVSDEQYRR
jgi:hypothetical protein